MSSYTARAVCGCRLTTHASMSAEKANLSGCRPCPCISRRRRSTAGRPPEPHRWLQALLLHQAQRPVGVVGGACAQAGADEQRVGEAVATHALALEGLDQLEGLRRLHERGVAPQQRVQRRRVGRESLLTQPREQRQGCAHVGRALHARLHRC
eukprot:scaffold27084_cov55-Phaeocystis_antarctica.AAC.2